MLTRKTVSYTHLDVYKRQGFYTKDDYGNVIEMGYKSEIIGVTLKDNPDVVRGKKANLILFEEGGELCRYGEFRKNNVRYGSSSFDIVAHGLGEPLAVERRRDDATGVSVVNNRHIKHFVYFLNKILVIIYIKNVCLTIK